METSRKHTYISQRGGREREVRQTILRCSAVQFATLCSARESITRVEHIARVDDMVVEFLNMRDLAYMV